MKKVFIHPPNFGDIEETARSNMALPQWGELFKKISPDEYLEYISHSDPYGSALDDEVFLNIRWSYLHMMVRITLVFPYIEVLKWVIDHTDTHKCFINDESGGCVVVLLPMEV
jgi:hypothetical protein